MKARVVAFYVVAALFTLSCPPGLRRRLRVTEDSLEISVTEIENLGGVACIVFVRSPEDEQEFELGAGESVTVTGITGPIGVGAVGG